MLVTIARVRQVGYARGTPRLVHFYEQSADCVNGLRLCGFFGCGADDG